MGNSDGDTDHYEGALLEEIREMFKAIQEGQDAMAAVPSQIASIEENIVVIKSEIEAIKAVVRIHSKDIDNHEVQITKLEGTRA